MADHYIDVLGRAIWEYDGKRFSLDHYKAMAWQGLEGTDVYENKPQAEKDAIQAKKSAVLQGRNNTNCNDHGN
ncbi:hypothetical protein ACFOET_04870 [Parapedobacter deserti]|uniref:Uncharacterized protein n=1 Tax=Parapedobacter deserti TaxID=1912957 RepID=A0ABV7JLK1_9SPHI